MCYIPGCRQAAHFWVRREHRTFGQVISCLAHDPARHGYVTGAVTATLPEGAPAAQGEPTPAELMLTLVSAMISLAQGTGGSPEGGTKVPRVPIRPRTPSPAAVRRT